MPRSPSPQAAVVLSYVAANVRRLRLKAGLSQEELSELAVLDTSFLARVERGRVNLSVGVLADLAVALEVEPGKLLRRAAMHPIRQGRPRK
jgi:transcriptional regulator with XRE-family HTH domain